MPITLSTEYNYAQSKDLITVTYTWTSDGSGDATASTDDHRYASQVITEVIKGHAVWMCQTVPGTTPTASYDIVINDANSEDIFGGNLANRSNSASETIFPGNGSVYGTIPIVGALTFVVSNAGASKTGSIILHLE